MDNMIGWMFSHPFSTLGIGAFACGVALFYLVMRRTMKHREKAQD